MNSKKALEKIDHTICMNTNEGNIKWDIDQYDHCACKDIDEFCKCHDLIYKDLEKLEAYRDLFKKILSQQDKSLEYTTSELEHYYHEIEGDH